MSKKLVSFIVPCFNEVEVLPEFYRRICDVATGKEDFDFEFIFINDGSSDGTAGFLDDRASSDLRVKVIHFARNLGHQAALTAGMDFARGDVVVFIDADLQDPPELISEALRKIDEGFDIIHMQRRTRQGESAWKLFTAWLFYKTLSAMADSAVVEDSGDFKIFTRRALRTLRAFREPHRFIRGLSSSLGFKQCIIQYDRERRHAGSSKYPFIKMVRLAFNATLSFSSAPIKAMGSLGILLWSTSLLYSLKALYEYYVLEITVQGWTSIIILLIFFTGIIIFCLSLVAMYIGRIFEQGQGRPLYWVESLRNIDVSDMGWEPREVQLTRHALERSDR